MTFDRLSRARPPKRDDIELARLYRGWEGSLETPAVTTPLSEGTVQRLNVLNHGSNTVASIEVVLLAVGQHAYFWFDTGPGSTRPDSDQLLKVTRAFDQIYAQSIAVFGPESNPGVDGDPRLHIVNASPLALCEVSLDDTRACGVVGYFDSLNTLPQTVDGNSNAREMFVMNATYFDSADYLNVLAHEFRHMIEDNTDRGDADWEAEGSATLAGDLLGLPGDGVRRANIFLAEPDQQLNSWTNGNTIPHYGQAYLFNRYIYDRLGPEHYRRFAASAESGLQAIDSLSAAHDLNITGHGIWLDWLTALAIHDAPGSPERYRFSVTGLDRVTMSDVASVPAEYEETVHQYAADYYRLTSRGDLTLTFEGSALVPLLDMVPDSGEMMWLANRANYAHLKLTRAVDLQNVDSATLQYSLYHDIEAGYDFAYVFVSQDDGHTWEALTAEHMQGRLPEDDPANAALGQRFYTGRSDGWRDEQIDLTPYAGQQIWIRFVYVTDQILTFGGIALDNIAIPEIGFYDDVESLADGWTAEGFERVTAVIPQQWHLQLITFARGRPSVEHLSLDSGRQFSGHLTLGEDGGDAIIIVGATAPMTLQPAPYRLTITG